MKINSACESKSAQKIFYFILSQNMIAITHLEQVKIQIEMKSIQNTIVVWTMIKTKQTKFLHNYKFIKNLRTKNKHVKKNANQSKRFHSSFFFAKFYCSPENIQLHN